MSKENSVLFLDLDGPVFPDVVIKYDPLNSKPYPGDPELQPFLTYWKMCDRFCFMFQHMLDVYDFKVVISSSWRKMPGYKGRPESFVDLFRVNELDLPLHEDWTTGEHRAKKDSMYGGGYCCARATEVHYWLQNHPEVTNFLVLDDIWSGASLDSSGCHNEWNPAFDYMKDSIVMVNPDAGLCSEDIERAYRVMKKWR